MANPKPENNVQHFLAKIAGVDTSTPVPQTIEEYYLEKIAEGGGIGGVTDVKIGDDSIVTDGVAILPIASTAHLGVVKVASSYGTGIVSGGLIYIVKASDSTIKFGTMAYQPIVPQNQHVAVFYGLAKAAGDTSQSSSTAAVGHYTEPAKSAISEMLNGAINVTGTTPTINARSGLRYVCGTVSTLAIALPAKGIVDVTFKSGSTATALTITPPAGITIKWVNGFDPTSLDANTTYELNIMDGIGVAVGVTA